MSDVLLLDYNGVLVNDEPVHFAAFREILGAYGLSLDEKTYYAEYLGFDDRSAFVEAWRRAHRTITGELLRLLIQTKADEYQKRVANGIPEVPGAAAFARAAAERMPVAIVSGALRSEIELGLSQMKLADIRVIVAQADTKTTKPDPAGYRLALTQLAKQGAKPLRGVAIEDSLPGLEAARGVGAGCVMISTSHPAAALTAGDAVWPDFAGRTPDALAPFFRTFG